MDKVAIPLLQQLTVQHLLLVVVAAAKRFGVTMFAAVLANFHKLVPLVLVQVLVEPHTQADLVELSVERKQLQTVKLVLLLQLLRELMVPVVVQVVHGVEMSQVTVQIHKVAQVMDLMV
jgi:hypothetical protein